MDNKKQQAKRGQVYSLIALLIILPLLIFLMFFLSSNQSFTSGIYEKIVADQVHDVAKDMENDFVRAMKIAGKRALLAEINQVVLDGVPLTDSITTTKELVLNGTIEGNFNILMHENTLDDWQTSILSIPVGFNINLEYENLEIKNQDGFNINMTVDLSIHVSDKHDIAKVEKTIKKSVLVSVEDLEDVMFPLNTDGFVSRTIKIYPYPYTTRKIVTGSGASGECSGNVTHQQKYLSQLMDQVFQVSLVLLLKVQVYHPFPVILLAQQMQ